MSTTEKRKIQEQQRNMSNYASNRAKAIVRQKLSQVNVDEQDDDGSGGGPGNRMLKGFTMEKLLDAVAKGKQKAQKFWRFLGQEGLDVNETKKSDLGKQREKAEKATNSAEQTNEQSENSKERALELKAERELAANEKYSSPENVSAGQNQDSAWRKAQASDGIARQMFVAEAARDAMSQQTKQSNVSVKEAQQSSKDRLGARVQGASHAAQQDHVGSRKENSIGADSRQFAFIKGEANSSNNASGKTEEKTKHDSVKSYQMHRH